MNGSTVKALRLAVEDLLGSLNSQQYKQISGRVDEPGYREWTYLPGPRAGLVMSDLSPEQRVLLSAVIEAAASPMGAETAEGIIELDMIRRHLIRPETDPDDHRFWIRVFAPAGSKGELAADEPWAFRINGHHLALHVIVLGDRIAVTPNFFGAEPALVLSGPHQGLRTLGPEEELARTLVGSLDHDQLGVAITDAVAPDDILTRFDPVADPGLIPAGIGYAELVDEQREHLHRLVRRYFDRAPLDHAESCWDEVVAAGLDRLSFGWAGSLERGQGHYYAVSGPTFLLEYDNTQDDANHIHSVWRDLRHDWGGDLLATHYAQGHHK